MDPEANLQEQLRLSARIYGRIDGASEAGLHMDAPQEIVDAVNRDAKAQALKDSEADVIRLCELVDALDEWIGNGGALPSSWVTM